MGKRAEQRIPVVLPVVVMGTDAEGKPLRQVAWTLDISAGGARLVGVPPFKSGETISILHNERKARFQTLWVGGRNTPLMGQMSVRSLEPENWIWSIPRPAKQQYRDAFRMGRLHASAGEAVADAQRKQDLAQRAGELGAELVAMAELVREEGLDPRLAVPIREALAYGREAMNAMQAWLEGETKGRDGFSALSALTLARLRLTSALLGEMITELEGGDLPVTSDDVGSFCRAVNDCARRIPNLK